MALAASPTARAAERESGSDDGQAEESDDPRAMVRAGFIGGVHRHYFDPGLRRTDGQASLNSHLDDWATVAALGFSFEVAYLFRPFIGIRAGTRYTQGHLDATHDTAIDRYDVDARAYWWGGEVGPEIDLMQRRLVLAPALGIAQTSLAGTFAGADLEGLVRYETEVPYLRLAAGGRFPIPGGIALGIIASLDEHGLILFPEGHTFALTLTVDTQGH